VKLNYTYETKFIEDYFLFRNESTHASEIGINIVVSLSCPVQRSWG